MDITKLANYLLGQISGTEPIPEGDMPAFAAFQMSREFPNVNLFLFNADMMYMLYSEDNPRYTGKVKEVLYGALGYMSTLRDKEGNLPQEVHVAEPLTLKEAISLAHRFAHEACGAYDKGCQQRMGRYMSTVFMGAGYALMFINGDLKEKEHVHTVIRFPQ